MMTAKLNTKTTKTAAHEQLGKIFQKLNSNDANRMSCEIYDASVPDLANQWIFELAQRKLLGKIIGN